MEGKPVCSKCIGVDEDEEEDEWMPLDPSQTKLYAPQEKSFLEMLLHYYYYTMLHKNKIIRYLKLLNVCI